MTNTSFSKISDLILPDKGQASGPNTDRRPAPGAVRQFERLLKTVADRDSGNVPARKKPATQPFDRGRPDIRPADRRPVADRPGQEPPKAERPDAPEREDVDRAEGQKQTSSTDDADRRDDLDADVSEETAEDENSDTKTDDSGEEPAADEAELAEVALETPTLAENLDGENVVPVDVDEALVGAADTAVISEIEAADQAIVTEVDDAVTATGAAAVTSPIQVIELTPTDETTTEAETIAVVASDAELVSAEAETEAPPVEIIDSAHGETEETETDSDEVAAESGEAAPEDNGQSQNRDGQAEADGEQPTSQNVLATTSSGSPNEVTATATVAGSGQAPLAVGETTARISTSGATAQTAEAGQVADGEDGDVLWRQVRRAIGSMRMTAAGDQQMTIRLRPAELGSVMVRVTTGEAGTTVALIAESAAAANQLNQQRQQLIAELEDGGLAEVAVDVGTNEDPQNQTDDSEGDGDQAAESGRGPSALRGQDGEPLDRFRVRRSGGSSAGLVDLDL